MALTLYELLGSAYHLSRVHNNLGISLYRLGRYPEAVAHYEQAIEGSRRLGNTPNLASALNNLGNLYTLIGSFSLAEDVLKSALEAARLCGNTRVEAYATCSLGRALTGAGHLHEARGMLQDAVRLAQLSGERVLEAQALLHQVIACAYAGDLDEAGALNREAAELLGSDPAPYTAGLVGFSQGLCSLLAGDASKALRRLAGAAAQFDQSGDIRWRERSTLLLAQASYQQRDLAAVAEYLDSIRETAQSEAGPASLRQDAPVAQEVLRYAVRALPAGAAFGRLWAVADAAASPAEPANAARLISLERPIVKAYGLGDFSVELNGVTLDESRGLTAKAKELLFFLLSTGRRTRREELMEALWPENDMLKDTSVLRTNVYRLRKVLYDHCIAVQGDSYRIDPAGHFWFDLHYFNELVQRSRQSQCSPVERVMLLETAVQLYRGPFLDEISSDWCVAKRYDVEIRFASAALSLATSYLQDGSAVSALQLCERVLTSDPFNEEAVLLLIRAHLALGDRNTALLQWRSFERRLQSETGSMPSRDIASRSELLLRAS